jgi:hypothetical protein
MQNVPADLKTTLGGFITEQAKASLKQGPSESPEDFARREAAVTAQAGALVKMLNELDQITLGWSVDAEAKKLVMDVSVTATAGSDTAKRYAEQADVRSAFGGFWRDDAVFSTLVAGKVKPDEAEYVAGNVAHGKRVLLDKIDKSDQFENEAQKAKVREVIGKLWSVFDAAVKSGQLDFGVTVLGEGPFTLAFAAGVADGAAADRVLRDVVQIVQDDGFLENVEYDIEKSDVEKTDGVTFHRITPRLGDAAEAVGKVLGSDPQVIVATGPKSVYLAVGSDPTKSLKELIAKSKETADRPVAPGQMVFALAPIIKYVSKQAPLNAPLAALAESMKSGSDRIRVSARLVPNGEATRLEIEEGVIKALAGAMILHRDVRAAPPAVEEAAPAKE